MDFMQMPADMSTYAAPMIPEPEDVDGLEAGARDSAAAIACAGAYLSRWRAELR